MNIVGVITKSDGFTKCYVSFKDLVASDGALQATPTVTSSDTDAFTVSGAALNSTQTTINSVVHPTSTLLTFTVTATGSSDLSGVISVEYETPLRDGKTCFRVVKRLTCS